MQPKKNTMKQIQNKFSLVLIFALFTMSYPLAGRQLDSIHHDFLMVNINKSVFGGAPSGEFSEVTAKISYTNRLFSFYSLDINLADTASSKGKDLAFLNQALVSLNFGILRSYFSGSKKEKNNEYKREFFVTGLMKGFNYEPYYGIGIGSIESSNKSKIFTTYFILSYLRSFFKQNLSAEPNFYNMNNIFFHHNMYIEFALKLKDQDEGKNSTVAAGFLTNARLKAGLLFPLNVNNYSLYNNPLHESFLNKNVSDFVRVRITLQIPVGGVIRL